MPQGRWTRSLRMLGLAMMVGAASTLAWTVSGYGQASQPTAQTAPAIPYITQALPEIQKLPSAPAMPGNARDLKSIQDRVEAVTKYALPATVGLIVGEGQGSGVIISKDGWILTAGHVSGTPKQNVTVIFSNGARRPAQAMGADNQLDAGLVKITAPGEYPFMPVGNISARNVGQWVIAMGHPGGYQNGRPPVVRLGKVLKVVNTTSRGEVQTDCPLIMGDSGGPVFDLDGRVVGINSKIGLNTTANIHVPIEAFTRSWDRLARGEEWGSRPTLFTSRDQPSTGPRAATLGLQIMNGDSGVVVQQVLFGSTAAELIKDNDIITRFDGKIIKTVQDLAEQLAAHKPDDSVKVDLLRNGKSQQVTVKLGAR